MTGTRIANQIRRLRFEHGELTQQAIADALRVRIEDVFQWQGGR